MDMISELPDALLLEILSLLQAKNVVETMVLSKRWKFLWRYVPRLKYDHNMYQDGEHRRFSRFLNTSLKLHRAPVLESFNVKFGQKANAIDIRAYVRTAIERGVRKLCIKIDTCSTKTMDPVVLPGSLFIGCKRLVNLLLKNVVLMDLPSSVSFPSLKSLVLASVKYPSDEFVPMLLSRCHVLENLIVDRCRGDNVDLFVVRVASLKVLRLRKLSDINAHGFLIDTPSLEILEIEEAIGGFCGIEHNMPKLEAANVYVTCSHTEQIISSLTSLEQLGVCLLASQDAYPEGTIFSRLVRLHLCTCDAQWLDVLMRLLKNSPKLRILRLEQVHCEKIYPRPCWKEPSHVPGCLLSSLETFEWMEYEGTEEEMEVARSILRNTSRLKIAAFYPKSTNAEEELEMLMELSVSPRCSPMCQLDLSPRTFKKRDIFLDHRLIRSLNRSFFSLN